MASWSTINLVRFILNLMRITCSSLVLNVNFYFLFHCSFLPLPHTVQLKTKDRGITLVTKTHLKVKSFN